MKQNKKAQNNTQGFIPTSASTSFRRVEEAAVASALPTAAIMPVFTTAIGGLRCCGRGGGGVGKKILFLNRKTKREKKPRDNRNAMDNPPFDPYSSKFLSFYPYSSLVSPPPYWSMHARQGK